LYRLRDDRKAQTAWEFFHNNITQYELYRSADTATPASSRSYVDDLLKNMASLPIVDIDEMTKKGTQIKLILKLSDRTKILFKPMRLTICSSVLASMPSRHTHTHTHTQF